jgi:acyl-coenzyme A synthetase/AMP-(fatty) acid ligase
VKNRISSSTSPGDPDLGPELPLTATGKILKRALRAG